MRSMTESGEPTAASFARGTSALRVGHGGLLELLWLELRARDERVAALARA